MLRISLNVVPDVAGGTGLGCETKPYLHVFVSHKQSPVKILPVGSHVIALKLNQQDKQQPADVSLCVILYTETLTEEDTRVRTLTASTYFLLSELKSHKNMTKSLVAMYSNERATKGTASVTLLSGLEQVVFGLPVFGQVFHHDDCEQVHTDLKAKTDEYLQKKVSEQFRLFSKDPPGPLAHSVPKQLQIFHTPFYSTPVGTVVYGALYAVHIPQDSIDPNFFVTPLRLALAYNDITATSVLKIIDYQQAHPNNITSAYKFVLGVLATMLAQYTTQTMAYLDDFQNVQKVVTTIEHFKNIFGGEVEAGDCEDECKCIYDTFHTFFSTNLSDLKGVTADERRVLEAFQAILHSRMFIPLLNLGGVGHKNLTVDHASDNKLSGHTYGASMPCSKFSQHVKYTSLTQGRITQSDWYKKYTSTTRFGFEDKLDVYILEGTAQQNPNFIHPVCDNYSLQQRQQVIESYRTIQRCQGALSCLTGLVNFTVLNSTLDDTTGQIAAGTESPSDFYQYNSTCSTNVFLDAGIIEFAVAKDTRATESELSDTATHGNTFSGFVAPTMCDSYTFVPIFDVDKDVLTITKNVFAQLEPIHCPTVNKKPNNLELPDSFKRLQKGRFVEVRDVVNCVERPMLRKTLVFTVRHKHAENPVHVRKICAAIKAQCDCGEIVNLRITPMYLCDPILHQDKPNIVYVFEANLK